MQAQLEQWLALQCPGIAGAEAALAVLGTSEHAPGSQVAKWPASGRASAPLQATLALALRRGEPVLQAREDAAELRDASSHLARPVFVAEQIVGAVGLSVRGLNPAQLKAVGEQLERTLRGLSQLVEATASSERHAHLLGMVEGLVEHEELDAASHAFAQEVARAHGCERVGLGLIRGRRLRVVALSNSRHFSEANEALRRLRDAMEEATEQDTAVAWPAAAESEPARAVSNGTSGARPESRSWAPGTLSHQQLLQTSGAGSALTLPLTRSGRCVGALLCEWRDTRTPSHAVRRDLLATSELCGPLLDVMLRADAGPIARLRRLAERSARHHLGEDPRVRRIALGLATLMLVLLMIAPGTHRVTARAQLEGRTQRALVAAVDGFVAETNARAGDLVREGEVLVRLDDRDLRLEHRSAESDIAQIEKEYREALFEQDRSRIAILRARIEKATAQLDLATEELGRTALVAPFDGVLLDGNLDQALGSPVERGQLLFEIAPLDGYRIIVQVDDRDIAYIAEGQAGKLTLSALPGRSLPLAVERITPIAVAEDGRNYFRVESTLGAMDRDGRATVAALRPGMEGVAKIEIGERRLLWIWTHGLIDWLRLALWSVMP